MLTISGLTLVQAIIKMMQYNERKAQSLSNFPSSVKDSDTCKLHLKLARRARNMDPETRSKHFMKFSRKIQLTSTLNTKIMPKRKRQRAPTPAKNNVYKEEIRHTDPSYGPASEWSDIRFNTYRKYSRSSQLTRLADASRGDPLQAVSNCTRYQCEH